MSWLRDGHKTVAGLISLWQGFRYIPADFLYHLWYWHQLDWIKTGAWGNHCWLVVLYYNQCSPFFSFQECKQWNGHYRSLSIRYSGTSTKQTRILGRIEIPIEISKCKLAEETWRTSPWFIIWSYNGELLGFVNLYANIACCFFKRLLYLDVCHPSLNFYTSTSHLKPLCQF